MANTTPSPIFCKMEMKSFPASQFSSHSFWGTIHNVHPPHTTEGTPIDTEEPDEDDILGNEEDVHPQDTEESDEDDILGDEEDE